ncbi:MAG: FAD-dependent oxidoreductase [Thermomicrobiales bacterium]
MSTDAERVVIVGAGLAGLSCGLHLAAEGIPFSIFEAADQVGGRVRTDEVRGFRLDRGFQVLLTAYPEAAELLDYGDLDLHPFYPGAFVRTGGRFHVLADPFRNPVDGGKTIATPVGSILDKGRVAQLRYRVRSGTLDDLWKHPETTSLNYLRQAGFSTSMIDGFFRPFFGGVFLEPDLRTSSRMLEFIFRMFAQGDIAIPATGMEAIPASLQPACRKAAFTSTRRLSRSNRPASGSRMAKLLPPVLSSSQQDQDRPTNFFRASPSPVRSEPPVSTIRLTIPGPGAGFAPR